MDARGWLKILYAIPTGIRKGKPWPVEFIKCIIGQPTFVKIERDLFVSGTTNITATYMMMAAHAGSSMLVASFYNKYSMYADEKDATNARLPCWFCAEVIPVVVRNGTLSDVKNVLSIYDIQDCDRSYVHRAMALSALRSNNRDVISYLANILIVNKPLWLEALADVCRDGAKPRIISSFCHACNNYDPVDVVNACSGETTTASEGASAVVRSVLARRNGLTPSASANLSARGLVLCTQAFLMSEYTDLFAARKLIKRLFPSAVIDGIFAALDEKTIDTFSEEKVSHTDGEKTVDTHMAAEVPYAYVEKIIGTYLGAKVPHAYINSHNAREPLLRNMNMNYFELKQWLTSAAALKALGIIVVRMVMRVTKAARGIDPRVIKYATKHISYCFMEKEDIGESYLREFCVAMIRAEGLLEASSVLRAPWPFEPKVVMFCRAYALRLIELFKKAAIRHIRKVTKSLAS